MATDEPGRIPCRKCLLEEIDPAAYERDIKRLLDLMHEDEKVPAAQYQSRLQTCRTCDYLNQATCNACGCYVELRAAVRGSKCPYRKW